ncbi:MAG TPA: hypothetical protein VMZ49_01485 [Patescibacteria group bacterium]|nr:hypothetical protein [Patescibacteria group bacterium]
MNKIKFFFPALLFSLLFSISFIAFATSGDGCDGCKRDAVLKKAIGLDKDWAAEYNRLKNWVSKNFDEPEGEPNQLEPYIRWMGIKAKDRDEVKALLEEVNRLSYLNPKDKALEQWTQKFFYLQELAQGSGISTVNGACMKFMRLRSPLFPKIANWKELIWRLQRYGRVIYTKAQETAFVSPMIKGYAKCLINFSIRDVEGDPYGFGVYRDREGLFGYMDEEGFLNIPDRDFTTDCERRGEFTLTSKGEPAQPTDIGLDWIEKVREEAKWWQLAGEYSDATDLMNEFFEDSMCKSPPNTPGQGHKNFYGKQALKHSLQKSIDYNDGFYGIVYGKVEIETSEGRTPAGYATVKVTDPHDKKTWETEADSEGNYEIKDVILHKDCSPFTITAASGIDKVIDQYDGPLEKPDRSYRYKKNLVIRKSPVSARITLTSETTTKADGTINFPGEGERKTIVKDNSYKIISVTILANFEEKPEVDFDDQLKVIGYNYKITNYKVISETYSDEGTFYEAQYDAAGRLRVESTSKTTRSGTSTKIELQSIESNTMSLDVDKTTGKINYVDFPFFDVMFIVNSNSQTTGRKESSIGNYDPINISDTKSYDNEFSVQSGSGSRLKVLNGDGVHFISGKYVDEHTTVDNQDTRTRTEKVTYQWEVRIQKK